jgi:hypothetical protein
MWSLTSVNSIISDYFESGLPQGESAPAVIAKREAPGRR